MTPLHYDVLRPEALALYRLLSSASELESMTLVGGTGLALQIKHRYSLDFDFATYKKILPTQKIDCLVSRLKSSGHSIKLIVDSTSLSQFKINTGDNLLDYVRDYTINGVKVTFFTHGRTQTQREYYKLSTKVKVDGQSFDLLGLTAMKTSKTLVLADRIRSRDLYDLMILMQDHNYSIDQQMKIITTLGHIDDTEYYNAVMTGRIPIDKQDEGLQAVKVNVSLEQMYAYFNDEIAAYETNLAEKYFSETDQNGSGDTDNLIT